MSTNCFFCDIQKEEDKNKIIENEHFFSRYDDFPVNPGHCEIISKDHVISFFNLSSQEIQSLFDLIRKTKEIVQKKFNPGGWNIGINEGKAAGATQNHVHFHLIPRYKGDIKNPRGGIRNVISHKADYVPKVKKMLPSRRKYVE